VTDLRTNQIYHPGVTLAVGEVIGEVAVYFGFWGVQKNAGVFHPLRLPEFPAIVPAHFPAPLAQDVLNQIRMLTADSK
jgi:hypothetical protein